MTIIWILIIASGIFIDITTSGFLFSIFSLSALISLVLNLLEISAPIQICVFSVLSLILIITLVPYIRKKLKTSENRFIPQENRLLGREFVLNEELTSTALVDIDGVFWTIKTNSNPISIGETVRIISIEGNKYIVEKIEGEN